MTDSTNNVLFTKEDIATRVKELGAQITKDYDGKPLVVICVLTGAFVFCADLIREIYLPIELDFIQANSYGDDTESSGQVIINKDVRQNLVGKDLLIVEDIVDSGRTISFLKDHFKKRGARSIKVASLLFKPERLVAKNASIDYLGFEIEDKFVVGYGLDYAGLHRELDHIAEIH